MKTCVTGATGFVGGHVARAALAEGHAVRVAHRDPARLERLGGLDVEPVVADILDRDAMRRAVRGCDLLLHAAGLVASRPLARVREINALAPRIAVEAAAAEGVERVVVTSSVAGIGPVPRGEIGSEDDPYRGGSLGLAYPDSKHAGELQALAAGARLGVEVVVVNPSYVLGGPLDRSQPGETSTRIVGNYLRGRLPAVVDGGSTFVHVEDVAAGHLLAAAHGRPGERYVLGGHSTTWPELMRTVARVSGVRQPLVVIPYGAGGLARRAEALRLPLAISAEALVLMEQNWCYSSAKAKRELGYRPRRFEATVRDTVEWYLELIESGALGRGAPSPLSLGAAGLRLAERLGALGIADLVGRGAGHRVVLR